MNLLDKTVHRIRRHRKQPEYGKLLKTMSDQFRIVLFTQEIYEVGRGGFGRCCLGKFYEQKLQKPQARDKEDQKQGSFQSLVQKQKVVVVKIIPKNKSAPNDELYMGEVDNLASACRDKTDQQCKNIVKIYPFKIISDNNYYLVMEYCYHSTLADLIQTRKRARRKFNLAQLLVIIQDLLTGYGLLRSKKIIHNDLKPHNIFIKDKIFKIGDFGISVKLNQNQKGFVSLNCTFPYSPIEKLQHKTINHKADIYALGLIFAQILFGKHPYFDQRQWKEFYSLKLEQQRIEKQNQNIIDLGMDQCPESPEGIIQMNRRKNERKKNIFIQYLKQKTMNSINLPTTIYYEPQDAQLVKEIKDIVIMMCGREEYRPTFQNVKALLAKLNNIKLTVLKYPKFEDLKYLRSSELNFDVNNMPKSSYSLVSNMGLRESVKRQHFSLVTFQKLLALKSRLSETANLVNLLYLIASNLNTSEKTDTVDIQLLKLQMYNYLYWVNQTELQAVTESIAKLNEQELAELYSMNIYKIMRNCQLDNDKLSELVFVQTQGNHLAAAREKLIFWLQSKYLNNITVSEDNYEEYYLFFIISDLIKCQTKYAGKEDKRFMAQEMEAICSLLTELEKEAFPYKFFQEREKEYVIFYK